MNDKLKKYPGMPRGEHTIFVGFDERSSGWRLFNPTTRAYVSGAEHVDFYEDMSARTNAFRHWDRRRTLEKKKVQQPLIIDDNEPSDYDQLSIEAVRNIYIDPEQVDVQPVELEVQQLPNDPPKDDGGESSEHNALDLIMKQIMPRQDEEVDSEAVDEAAKEEAIQQKQLKLKNEHEKKKAAQDVLEAVDMRRPLRLSAVGVVQPRSTRDKKFIKLARVNDFEIVYLQNNPKVKGDAKKFPEGKISWKLYERFKKGTTIKGAIELGATMDRINDDYEHGYIRFPGRESREPGHVFLADGEKASVLVCLLGIVYDMGLSNTGDFEYALKGAEEAAKKAEEKLRKNFNEVIATCYDAEEDCRRILDGRGERECCKGKAPNASLSRTPPAQGTRSARLRVQVLVCNRKFTVHLWMYAARYCGRNRNPSEARSHAGKEACGCCQTLDPIRVQYAQAWHKIFTRQRR